MVAGGPGSGAHVGLPRSPATDGAAGPVPKVSVIIAAHARVQFLKQAVASVAAQGPEEIVVVKYTRDPDLDRELLSLGALVHWTQEPYQGGKVAEGIERASGDVVALLDDDDVFLPGKIARLREAFSDPRVVFYANRYLPFTDTPPPTPEPAPIRLFHPGEGNLFREGLRPALSSCIAARRATMLPWVEQLRKLTIADHTMFMFAVTTRQWMAMDGSVLTGYRVGRIAGALRPAQSIWSRPGASAEYDIKWMLDLLDAQTDGVRATLNPMVANAVIHLVFLTGDTRFHEYRRTMRAVLDGVGLRRPLVVPSTLMFGYPLFPRLAISINRVWKSVVGYHHHQG
jgi:glycosyltransferase involved in cell wall biosynthesis